MQATERIAYVVGKSRQLKTDLGIHEIMAGKPRAGDVKHSLPDITAARKLIGYEPVTGFREGLEESIDWYRRNLA